MHATIKRHAVLNFGIAEGAPGTEASFIRLSTINRNDVIQILYCDDHSLVPHVNEDSASMDHRLESQLGQAHEKLWASDGSMPVWKVIVLVEPTAANKPKPIMDNDLEKQQSIDVVFIAHHAVADGLSGVAFHKSFHDALYQAIVFPAQLSAQWPYAVLKEVIPPTTLEQLVDFSSATRIQKNISTDDNIWAGLHPIEVQSNNFHSRVKIVSIPSEHVVNILKHCKSFGITLTGYLHGAIQVILSRKIEGAQAFRFITPYSIRSFTGAHIEDIVNHISYMERTTREGLVEGLRCTSANSNEELTAIVNIARQFKTESSHEMSLFPGGSALADIYSLADVTKYCVDQFYEKRSCTYELSNLGVGTFSSGDTEVVQVEKMVFSQCGMVVGPAIGCNVVSVKGGSMTVTLTWQEGVVDSGLIQMMAESICSKLCR